VITETAAPYRGMYSASDTSAAAAADIIEGWKDRQPTFVIAIPDHTSPAGAPYSRSFPPSLYDSLIQGRGPYRLAVVFEHRRLFPWLPLPALDYPTVSPPIRIFEKS
jgi:hypothetical protein